MASSGVLNASDAFDIQADDKTLVVKPDDQYGNSDTNSNSDAEKGRVSPEQDLLDWENSPHNPYNWPSWKKALMVTTLATMGLTV